MSSSKDLVKKTVVYNLPLIKGFHAYTKLDITPQNRKAIYQNFGLNFWDLINASILQKSKYMSYGILDIGNIHVDFSNCPGILLFNCSKKDIISVKNEENSDVYNIGPLSYALYNSYGNDVISAKVSKYKKKTFVRNSKKRFRKKFKFSEKTSLKKLSKDIDSNSVWIQCSRFGDAYYVFLKVEDIVSGLTTITELSLYKNLLLCSGIINEDQYLKNMSLNGFLDRVVYDTENNKKSTEIYVEDMTTMDEFIMLLQDQWEYVNPINVSLEKQSKDFVGIPPKIHWIWLSKTIQKTINEEAKESSVSSFKQFMMTWSLRNPNLELNIWTNSASLEVPPELKDRIVIRNLKSINETINLIKGTPLKNLYNDLMNIIHRHPNVGIRADTLRQVILYTIGGLYTDINDMACLIPFEPYLNNFDFICGLEPMMYINNAIIGSKKGHCICERFLRYICYKKKTAFEEYDNSKDFDREERDNFVVGISGPIAFSSVVFGTLFDNSDNDLLNRTCIFPSKFLYSNYQITESSNSWMSPFSMSSHYDKRDFI